MNALINSIYIFINSSGLNLISRSYVQSDIDPQLMSGFISALDGFSKMSCDKNGLKFVDMGQQSIYFLIEDNITFASVVEQNEESMIIMDMLESIKNKFMERYKGIIGEWSGALEIFTEFYNVIDSITDMGNITEKMVLVPIMSGRIVPLMIRFGEMSKIAYDVADMCNGNNTINDISDLLGIEKLEVRNIVSAFEILGMLQWNEITKIEKIYSTKSIYN